MTDGGEEATLPAEPNVGALAMGRESAAVIAHGLLNTCFVLSGSAFALRHFTGDLTDVERRASLTALAAHATLLDDGLRVVIQHCSDAFANAATAVALAARAIRSVSERDLPDMLDGLVERLQIIATGLRSLVRGLPAEVVSFLETQRREDAVAPTVTP